MSSKKAKKPEFYKQFMQEPVFPDANKVIKFQDSTNYWIFKTGKKIYKVKKKAEIQTSVPIEELFCREMIRQLTHYSPELDPQMATIEKDGDVYKLNLTGASSQPAQYCVVVMEQLADRYFLDNLISKKKVTEKTVSQLAIFLAEKHKDAKISDSKDVGTPEYLNQKLQDLIYQSKKHLGHTITQPMIDMIVRPLERYIQENRKMLNQRIKKGHIKEIHGNFISRKIHMSPAGVCVLGRTTDPLRDRVGDVARDLADLTVDLVDAGLDTLAEGFIKEYVKAADDKEAKLAHPVYQALNALRLGLENSTAYKLSQSEDKNTLKEKALAYYEQTIEVARQL